MDDPTKQFTDLAMHRNAILGVAVLNASVTNADDEHGELTELGKLVIKNLMSDKQNSLRTIMGIFLNHFSDRSIYRNLIKCIHAEVYLGELDNINPDEFVSQYQHVWVSDKHSSDDIITSA